MHVANAVLVSTVVLSATFLPGSRTARVDAIEALRVNWQLEVEQ